MAKGIADTSKGSWTNPKVPKDQIICADCRILTYNALFCDDCLREKRNERTTSPYDVEFFATRRKENDPPARDDLYIYEDQRRSRRNKRKRAQALSLAS